MALTERQRQRVLYHLQYTQLSTPTTLSLGDPSVTLARFRVDQNLTNLLPITEPDVIATIDRLDCIETQLDQLRASAPWVAAVGTTKFDFETGLLVLEDQQQTYRLKLADQTSSQINPVSNWAQDRYGGVSEGDMR